MKNILLLQTGGTIAMYFEKEGVQLDPSRWSELIHKEMPELSRIANIDIEHLFFEDSSDINKHHWIQLSETIYRNFHSYNGFVILHGTDTMAYTASALSFSLKNLSKPVILTGSQVPMSNIRSDARRNLVNSVELATHPVPEVAICFNDHLFRGNRSTKMSIGDFDAFASPNFPSLAEVGINIKLSDAIIKQAETEPICNPVFDDAVFVLKIHPNLSPSILDTLDLSRIKAIIIEAFGIGNIPIKEKYSLLPFVEKSRKNGCHVIINSQAAYDSVDLNKYKSGRKLQALGAIGAGDMTMEATITKTMHLLASGLADEEFKTQFMSSVSGERSVPS
jgi:L-asparaginase